MDKDLLDKLKDIKLPEHNLTEKTYFWAGKLSDFPEELNVKATVAKFDYHTNTVTECSESEEQFVLTNVDHDWLVINQLQGNRNPVELKECNYSNGVYTFSDKVCIKIRRMVDTYEFNEKYK